MNSWDLIATAILGYLSVPLVSLAVRKHWPDQLKFIIAAALSVGFAVGELALHHTALTTSAILAAAYTCFLGQQATWHLNIPGAGSPSVNQAFLQIGSKPADVGQPDPSPVLEDVPQPPAPAA